MEAEFELVTVEEFDALSIELQVPKSEPVRQPPTVNGELNDAWLNENVGKFPAKTHVRKVAKELNAETGLIYLPGQEEKLYEDSDQSSEFRQRRYFYYVAGADFPGCAVTYDIWSDHLILWIPYTDPKTVLWYGTTPTIEQCKAASDVDDVRYIAGLNRYLCAALDPGDTLYVLHPDQAPRLESARGAVRIDATKLAPAADRARVVKTDYEIAMIRRANAVSSAAHNAVLTRLKHLSNEREIEAIFRGFCLARGAKRQAYPVIAASGTAASTLHYSANDQALAGRPLVVLDAGAEWRCYASDVTRTLPLCGSGGGFGFASDEAAAVYALVSRMQDECVRRVRPGASFAGLHLRACAVAAEGLRALGILRGGTVREILASGTVAAFFPHGLGHHVGLEVHDVSGRGRLLGAADDDDAASLLGDDHSGLADRRGGRALPRMEWIGPEAVSRMYREATAVMPPAASEGFFSWLEAQSERGRQKLVKNMVVTIEPGIYFCREYIKAYFLDKPEHARYIDQEVLEKYWDVGGVRIEDDILVTDDGYENLTTAPKGEEMLKIINEGGSDCQDWGYEMV
ncbi:hypothetical protein VTK56DRAFT_8218 [Thermocarpiscus australiensis]